MTKKENHQFRLTEGEQQIVDYIRENPDITRIEVANGLKRSYSTISVAVSRLHSIGFISDDQGNDLRGNYRRYSVTENAPRHR